VNPGDPIGKPVDPPSSLLLPPTWPRSDVLSDLALYRKPVSRATGQPVDWAAEMRAGWRFGEEGGYANLQHFLEEGLPHYQDESARADHQVGTWQQSFFKSLRQMRKSKNTWDRAL
jgi:hypothetical protein